MPFFLYALTLGALKAIETYIYQYISNKEQNNNIVIDYEHLKNDPKSTLKSIYNIIGIIVDDNEMDMIIEESNLRSNSLGKVFPSQLQKTWFLNRVDQKSQYNLKLAIAITNIVSLLMNISIFRYLSLALLKRLPNRTTYKYP